MPICERDPWRFQFFENVACPDDCIIPTDDIDCWPWFPHHRWVYDKLKIAESQGLACGPHGVLPPHYPVFSKPIINLRGMGIGSRIIASPAEMQQHSTAGHFWMQLLEGDHVSTDCAVIAGNTKWIRHATGEPTHDGMFKHWTIHAAAHPTLEKYLRHWVSQNLPDYNGMLNFETIGGLIIELHLRFSDQWCDLYGKGWVDALVKLYAQKTWNFADTERRDGFSIPLFAKHGQNARHPSLEQQQKIRTLPHVSSLQITFHETMQNDAHAMPPGGFRLGIINATDLQAGQQARRELGKLFPGVELLVPE
jgi:hypothetical protein